jgi:hypothetical protein
MLIAALGGGAADVVLGIWFVLVAVSSVYVAYDAATRNPELTVMKWGWVLVTLYIGPFGASLYVLSCQEPASGAHEEFVAPLWKQSLGSTIHCVAGDATGIVVAAAVTTAVGFPMWADTIVEYVAGFAFGLLIFQSLFMRDMLGGRYVTAVRSTVLAEWLSMNCVMAGMVPVMVIIRTHVPGTTDVGSVRFWSVLSLAVFVGLVVAYPVNVWLVRNGLKHGMGTVRALGEGGTPLPDDQSHNLADGSSQAVASSMSTVGTTGGTMDMSPHGRSVTRAEIGAVAALTLLFLATSLLIAAAFGDFSI